MPLKRVTPSFTVEYRQAKRPNAASAKPNWVYAKPPEGVDENVSRIAISAFKTVAARSPAYAVSPSIPRGHILPSLVEVAPVTAQPDVGRNQSKSHSSAVKTGYVAQTPGGGTVRPHFGKHAYPENDPAPLIAVATISQSM
jgi:hypothetical protein